MLKKLISFSKPPFRGNFLPLKTYFNLGFSYKIISPVFKLGHFSLSSCFSQRYNFSRFIKVSSFSTQVNPTETNQLEIKSINHLNFKYHRELLRLNNEEKYNEMIARFEKLKEDPNFQANSETYQLVFEALAKQGDFIKMFEYVNEMISKKINLKYIPYELILETLEREGKIKERNMILNELQNQSSFLLQYYHLSICQLAKQGDFNKIQQKLNEMKAKNIPLMKKTLISLIVVLAQYGHHNKMESYIQSYKSRKWSLNEETLNHIISCYAKIEDFEKLEIYMKELDANKFLLSSSNQELLIKTLLKHKRFDELEKFLQKYRSERMDLSSTAYGYVMSFYSQQKNWEKFNYYFTESKKKKRLNIPIMISLILASVAFKRPELLDELYSIMNEIKMKPTQQMISPLIVANLKFNRIQETVKIFEELESSKNPWKMKMGYSFVHNINSDQIPPNNVELWKELVSFFNQKSNSPSEDIPSQEKEKLKQLVYSLQTK